MRVLRVWWRRIHGWWLVSVAAAASAAMAAVARAYPGLAAAILVAVGGAVAAAISERGRGRLADEATGRARSRTHVYRSRIGRIRDPIRLGVHPAATVQTADGRVDRVPLFVPRDCLPELVAALTAGGFVLVVGDSTAGKTRLAYEAMRAALPRYTCVQPLRPDALGAAVSAAREARPSVLWLDDLERYLGIGGLAQADVADLLSEQTVVVLATMRAHEREDFSARHDPVREHNERQLARSGREVLQAATTEIRLPRLWSPAELALAERSAAEDPRIAYALGSTDKHGLAEYLAAGPQLLRDLHDARSATGSRNSDTPVAGPRGAALVTAAVDTRLAGYHRPLPLSVLRDLHEVYLNAWGGPTLRPEPWDAALSWATQPLHATSSLLEPVGDGYLAFDYLVDMAAGDPATPPVPDAVWSALIAHAAPADTVEVAWRASFLGHTGYAEDAFTRAADAGEYAAAAELADCLGAAGREDRAIDLLEATIARVGLTASAADLITLRGTLAWHVGAKVDGHGNPELAMAVARQVFSDSTAVYGSAHPKTLTAKLTLARQVGSAGDPNAALVLAREVEADAARALGSDDWTTLGARFEVAVWIRELDGPAAGARCFTELIEQAQQLRPKPWSLMIDSMWNLAGCLSDAGDHARAVEVSAATVDEARQAYGDRHGRVLQKRLTHSRVVGLAGDTRSALELATQLAADSAEILGQSHLTTLEARYAVARWTAAAGGQVAARVLYDALLADVTPLLGEDHWLAQDCRTAGAGAATDTAR
jgi:hypothetical protein